MDLARLRAEVLKREHKTDGFDCGDVNLNSFLNCDALNWQSRMIAVTRVITFHDQIIGFYCLSADSIRLDTSELEPGLEEKRILDWPAVKIGRLGRSISYRAQGIGEFIFQRAIGEIREVSKSIGVRFVTVDAYPTKVGWYEKFGFIKNTHKAYRKKRNVSMRLSIYEPA
jgi:predicted GNAT family N-acyltransferase